jgi:CheY-like chemotaxis protein
MQQVFLDLILNAHQAMIEGGTLTVSSRHEADTIEIRVEDDGPGIKPEHLSRIFEPFFTTKGALGGATIPGTGLGLSGAYNVVRHHGGQIQVKSEYGHGASFVITLPVRALHDNPESIRPARDGKDVECRGRILVVDDDATVRALVTEILEELGHDVQQADTALQAVHRLESWRADMLIVDRMAPGMDDMRAYETIRQHYPRLPILFIMNRDSTAELEAEGDPWMFRLNKPFRNRDLVTLVFRVLSQSLDTAS